MHFHFKFLIIAFVLLLSNLSLIAEEKDTLQLAKDSENPLAKLAVVPIRLNIYPNVMSAAGGSMATGIGTLPESATTNALLSARQRNGGVTPLVSPFPTESFHGTLNTFDINPTYPIAIADKQYILLRWQQAISFAENVYAPHSTQNGLGDANPSFDYVYAFTENLMFGGGAAIVVPTATNHFLGMGKWCGGPSITAVWTPGKWVVGVIAQNIFSFAGPDSRPKVNIMTVQPLVNYNFGNGWYATSNPYWIANWRSPSRDRWMIPIGGGIGKLFTINKQPMTFSAAAYWYPVTPRGGPDWSLRFTLQYIFPQNQNKSSG